MMKRRTVYEGPWAEAGELFSLRTGEWRYQRPVTRSDKCRRCGTCYLFCPTGCIEDRGGYFAADLDYCKGCALCAQVCPQNAIAIVREER